MVLNNALIIKSVGAIIGGSIGFAYWYFIGCQDGCTIQSVWWRMSLWGAVMGYLSFSIFIDYIIKNRF